MASDWQQVELQDVAAELTVGFVGPMATEYLTHGVPFLRSLNIEPLRVKTADMKFISDDFHRRLKKSALSPGDVVIVRTGKPGACAVIPEWLPVANCSDVVVVRCGKRLDPHFLAYYVNAIAHQHVSAHLVGAVQQHFNVGAARKIKMPLPSLPEQAEVITILRALDKRIDALQQETGSLEAIARAIFKSWFVDFDPVRAKAEGREPEGMDAATAALFPGQIVGSSVGEIPFGWTVCPLSDTAEFLNGLALQKYPARSNEEWLPAIKIAQLKRGSVEGADRISPALPERYVIHNGDLLFSWSGSLEVDVWCGGDGALNQHLFKVASQRFPQWFVAGWLREHLPRFREIAASKVTTMGHIQRHHLQEAMVLLPPRHTLEALGGTIAPLHERIVQSRLQMRTLGELRDALLPRLISGKLRVPEAEKLVEALV